MLRKVLILLVACFLGLSTANAGWLETLFNPTNHVLYNGTSLTIGNIKIGNHYYWIKYQLQSDLKFTPVDFGKVNSDNYVDLEKLFKSKGGVEVDKSTVESLGFTNLEGCEKFFKLGNMYACSGANFFRSLGYSWSNGNSTYVKSFIIVLLPKNQDKKFKNFV